MELPLLVVIEIIIIGAGGGCLLRPWPILFQIVLNSLVKGWLMAACCLLMGLSPGGGTLRVAI
jgi:hypothetical protein